jgi:hypothetical protein
LLRATAIPGVQIVTRVRERDGEILLRATAREGDGEREREREN